MSEEVECQFDVGECSLGDGYQQVEIHLTRPELHSSEIRASSRKADGTSTSVPDTAITCHCANTENI